MDSLRHRVPFKASADDEDDERPVVLDDAEQEELIDSLRESNTRSTAQTLLVLDVVLLFSCALHIVYLLKHSKDSPLLAVFPPAATAAPDPDPPLPWPAAFTLLALALHANIVLHLHPIPRAPTPLSYPLAYALAAVAPTLTVFLSRSWQATAWAALPAAVLAVAHTVHASIAAADKTLAELESLKYRAPGP
ncbi:hypothetical protein B0H10DRAFT_2222340 [Mycena sp. CBHHK59/15]|nr:hypothetical protein B0H10DRAFT_2222340 [Mycena sp. CBHHK59/15]